MWHLDAVLKIHVKNTCTNFMLLLMIFLSIEKGHCLP